MQVFDEKNWENFKVKTSNIINFTFIPYFRRVIRLLALPYCYLYMVNWEQCKKSRLRVSYDFVYIFFVLKYFPDNYSLCRLWEKPRSEWAYYYGSNYDPYQRRQLRKEVLKKEFEIIFEDKNICYQLCVAGNLPLPVQLGYVESQKQCTTMLNEYFLLHPEGKIIIKPVRGKGGAGILIAQQEKGVIKLSGKKNNFNVELYPFDSPCVLQKFVEQHPHLNLISSSSVNTVRIVTLLGRDNEVIFLGALIRFGVDGAMIDNTSQGGIPVGIDIKTGLLMEYGYDFSTQKYDKHPTSKVAFKGFSVPLWTEVCALAEKTQRHFCYQKLIGHDIAITKESGPIIIELNSIYDNVGLEKSCGPILKNDFILEKYMEYGLLINKKQYGLYYSMKERKKYSLV